MAATAAEATPEVAPGFDPSTFQQVLSLTALRVPARRIQEVQKHHALKELIFRRRGVQNILPVDGDKASKLMLMKEEVSLESPPAPVQTLLDESNGSITLLAHEVPLEYEHLRADEVLAKILPQGVEVPRGFETIGHIAHFNLRDTQWPHRFNIGKVILDKNPGILTVVAKVGKLNNEFRTFDMEVIAGKDDTLATLVEEGLRLRFDFRNVYWNSKLSQERVKLLAQVQQEDIIMDLFAGVGAFALMCAEKGCSVFANDKNPSSAEAMRDNATLNKLQMQVTNLCAREAVKQLEAVKLPSLVEDTESRGPRRVHVIMNLPELALDFLDAFRDMALTGETQLFCSSAPLKVCVHCHCFAREKEKPQEEINPRVLAAMGTLPEGMVIREVRDVAPKKNMYCVEFQLMLKPRGAGVSDAKRPRIDNNNAGT